jgi:hypothetical protein
MHDPTTPEIEQVTGDARGRRTAGLVLVLIVVFIGVAIAKPWGSPQASTSQPPAPVGTPGAAVSLSPAATGTAVPSPAAPTPAEPSADPFTMPVPPPETATWTGIRWQRLASDDPLRLVGSMLRWRGGYIAVGTLASGGATTIPVWTSRDGGLWTPVPFGTATTFWPGLLVVGVAEVPSGLVALTLLDGSYQCGAACPTYGAALPLMAWTSPDGRSLTPNTGPVLGQPVTWHGPPLLAAEPAGLIAASPASPTRVATSTDGMHWRTMPAPALPTGLAIRDIVGTTTGFTAVGTMPVDADHDRAVAFQSVNGTTWIGPYALHLVSASGVILASTGPSWGAAALVAGRSGLIAAGQVFATPGAALWGQSATGRDWRALPNWPPLGPTTCQGEGCGSQPNGALVGDGHRMVALRGGPGPGVWTSTDGLAWQRLPVAGDIPGEDTTNAVLLPGGVLLSDGTTTWFGEAQAP